MIVFVKRLFWMVTVMILSVPRLLFAAGGGTDTSRPVTLTNPLKAQNLADLIRDVLIIVRDIGFLVAVFFIVYAGFLFVTARGSDDKLSKAKQALLWAVVGTAVLLGAWVFAEAIQGTVDTLKV